MSIISVPKPLREKPGEDGADALIELMNRQADSGKEDVITLVEEKFERRLSAEMSKINERITQEIGSINERITQETRSVNERITQEASGLEVMISRGNANLIKWMFIFWIGQVAALFGILFAFFR